MIWVERRRRRIINCDTRAPVKLSHVTVTWRSSFHRSCVHEHLTIACPFWIELCMFPKKSVEYAIFSLTFSLFTVLLRSFYFYSLSAMQQARDKCSMCEVTTTRRHRTCACHHHHHEPVMKTGVICGHDGQATVRCLVGKNTSSPKHRMRERHVCHLPPAALRMRCV